MGAEQSSESRKKEDEKYLRILINALEQMKTYEEKCKELLQAQQKTKASQENNECTLEEPMMKHALEKQREVYERKYNKMLEEQRMKELTEARNKQCLQQNATLSVETQGNYAPLYPSLQQVPTVETQPSTSTATYHLHMHLPYASASNTPTQNKSIFCQPSAPIAPTAPEISSATHQKQRVKPKNKATNNVYQCPSCKLHIKTETNLLFQCQKGHSSCTQCKQNAVKCGICKSTITNMRNIELEGIIENQLKNNVQITERVNCPNKSDGCSLSFKPENLQAHLKECVYREMECPLASAKYRECHWRGKINQMQAHFLEYHPQQTGVNVDTEICFDLTTFIYNHYSIYHIAMGNFHFIVHVKLDDNLQTLFMTVQLIGSQVSASKWTYEFHVYEKGEPRRKFTYVDACLPTSIPFSDVANEAKCAALPLQYAMSFFKTNKLTYKFYIKRDESKIRANQRRNNKERSVQPEN